jgi:hypothetical protein
VKRHGIKGIGSSPEEVGMRVGVAQTQLLLRRSEEAEVAAVVAVVAESIGSAEEENIAAGEAGEEEGGKAQTTHGTNGAWSRIRGRSWSGSMGSRASWHDGKIHTPTGYQGHGHTISGTTIPLNTFHPDSISIYPTAFDTCQKPHPKKAPSLTLSVQSKKNRHNHPYKYCRIRGNAPFQAHTKICSSGN